MFRLGAPALEFLSHRRAGPQVGLPLCLSEPGVLCFSLGLNNIPGWVPQDRDHSVLSFRKGLVLVSQLKSDMEHGCGLSPWPVEWPVLGGYLSGPCLHIVACGHLV